MTIPTKRTFDGVVFTRPQALEQLITSVQQASSLVTVERDFLLFAIGVLDGDPEPVSPEPAHPEPAVQDQAATVSPEAAPPPKRKKTE